jgi:diamine N-acetyltransferase
MGKRYIPPFQGERVRLRLLEVHDLPRTLAWRNQDHIRQWFFFSERLTPEQHAGWFARYQQRDDDFVFIIEEIEGGGRDSCACPAAEEAENHRRPVGQVAIYNIDWLGGTAEFGRLMIGEPRAAGRGLGREATDAAATLAFDRMGLQEVHLDVIPHNVRAIKVYEACGFEVTGRTEGAVRMSKRAVANPAHGKASPA